MERRIVVVERDGRLEEEEWVKVVRMHRPEPYPYQKYLNQPSSKAYWEIRAR